MEHETFWSLLSDPAHWLFELFLIVLFDVIIGVIIWPRIKKAILHHQSDDQKLDELATRLNEVRRAVGLDK